MDPEVETTTATPGGRGRQGARPPAASSGTPPSRRPGSSASAGPEPSIADVRAGMSTWSPAAPGGISSPTQGRRAAPRAEVVGGSSWRSQGRRPPCVAHIRQRVRWVARMVQGDPLLPGQGVPGGAPGWGSAGGAPGSTLSMVHMLRSTWRWCVQQSSARLWMSVAPLSAQSVTWWAWQFSAGIWQPGMMHPPSRVARALRCAGWRCGR